MRIERLVSGTVHLIKKESPVILGVLGAVGVVLTAVTVSRDTLKAEIRLEDKEDEIHRELTKTEWVQTVLPAYIPSIAVGSATVACIIASTVLNQKQKVALSSAYILLDQSYKQYKDKVVEMFGEGADREVEREVTKDRIQELKKKDEIRGDETLIFYEKHYNQLFERSMLEVKDAEYLLNKKFTATGQATLNDFYLLLGLKETKEGAELGWDVVNASSPEECWIDFEHDLVKTQDGMQVYEILFENEPTLDYDVPF
jgi:hypothetical protein|nr:MAG TPA: hypothetical protein [Caudoviricetes sp.]